MQLNLKKGAQILGIHLEGPFISPFDGVRGIHSKSNLELPSLDLFDKFLHWSENSISLIALAP